MKGIICDRCKTPKSRGDACWVKFQSSFFLFARMQQTRKFDLCNACAQAVTLFVKGETKRYTNDPLLRGDDGS